jgi:A/G-specific adenine glycosylase
MPEINSPLPDRLIVFFQENLLEWAQKNPRPMPWKGVTDPYKIWLSEVILQQTRVEQGLPYYEKFIRQYPSVQHLADAPEDALMKLWEGLGYYSRARNLHAAAKYIVYELNGVFPTNYQDIRALKGVGNYTAAAIASFAFGLPYAVLDGNVYRVIARFLGIDSPTNTPAAQKQFAAMAQGLLNTQNPAAHNQAMMDFGATCCTPQQPRCTACPLSVECQAFLSGRVAELPIKSKALVKKKRAFYYWVVHHGPDVFVRKRAEKDIWRGLWEFPQATGPELLPIFEGSDVRRSGPFRQLLTHQAVTAFFYEVELAAEMPTEIFEHPFFEGCERISRKDLKKNIAFPKVIDCYLQNKVLTLN